METQTSRTTILNSVRLIPHPDHPDRHDVEVTVHHPSGNQTVHQFSDAVVMSFNISAHRGDRVRVSLDILVP